MIVTPSPPSLPTTLFLNRRGYRATCEKTITTTSAMIVTSPPSPPPPRSYPPQQWSPSGMRKKHHNYHRHDQAIIISSTTTQMRTPVAVTQRYAKQSPPPPPFTLTFPAYSTRNRTSNHNPKSHHHQLTSHHHCHNDRRLLPCTHPHSRDRAVSEAVVFSLPATRVCIEARDENRPSWQGEVPPVASTRHRKAATIVTTSLSEEKRKRGDMGWSFCGRG